MSHCGYRGTCWISLETGSVESIGFGRIEEKGSEKFSKVVRANHDAIWGCIRGCSPATKEIYTTPPQDPDSHSSCNNISLLEHLIYSFKKVSLLHNTF
jgi:hypothetical protein